MKRWIYKLLAYFLIMPFAFSIVTLILFTLNINPTLLTVIVMGASGLIGGFIVANTSNLPSSFGKRYAPVIFPLGYTLILWMIATLMSDGFYGHTVWIAYAILQLPFVLISIFTFFIGNGILLFLAPVTYYSAFFIAFTLVERIRKDTRSIIHKPQLISVAIVLLLAFGIGQTVHFKRSQTVLTSHGFEYAGGYSSTDLWPYHIENPYHILPQLKKTAAFTVDSADEAPILDGAEAAFPVYSAFALATYDQNILKAQEDEYISFTNTIYAFERLLNGEIDIFFGAEPSDEQLKLTQKKDQEIVMTPIGKEAFVFFVNKNNLVNNLEVTEIKNIYSGKIKNWQEVGGNDSKIVAFQRPKNSGSQTLLEKVMGDTPLAKPLKEEVPAGMGGILEQVADYRNYHNSLGFSFRFFATGMHQFDNMKLLAINGIEPDPENISQGTYPFTANLYAITLKDNKKTTIQPFIEWMQGPQGQEIVEKIGYVKLEKK